MIIDPAKDVLKMVEYNIDQNGTGGDGKAESGIEAQIKLFKENERLNQADVIFLIEVSRGCKASNYINGAEAFAKALHMNYAYAVEYRVNNDNDQGIECTMGNAILSKYPLNNAMQYTFQSQNPNSTYGIRDGGRQMISAQLSGSGINHIQDITLVATHLEAGTSVDDFIASDGIRTDQAREVTQFVNNHYASNQAIVVAGDFNTPNIPLLNGAYKVFTSQLYDDPMFYIAGDKTTNPDSPIAEALKNYGFGLIDFQLDYFLVKSAHAITNYTQIFNQDHNILGKSDHVPISAALALKPR